MGLQVWDLGFGVQSVGVWGDEEDGLHATGLIGFRVWA